MAEMCLTRSPFGMSEVLREKKKKQNKTPAWRILRIIVISDIFFLCFLRPSSTCAHLGVHKAKKQEKLLKFQQHNDFCEVSDVGSVFNISISHSTSPHSCYKVTFMMDSSSKTTLLFLFCKQGGIRMPFGIPSLGNK